MLFESAVAKEKAAVRAVNAEVMCIVEHVSNDSSRSGFTCEAMECLHQNSSDKHSFSRVTHELASICKWGDEGVDICSTKLFHPSAN